MFSKLEGILNSANKAGSSQDGKAGEQDLVYELQFKPHQVELDVSAQAVNLTTRLERLENVLGNSNEQKLVWFNSCTSVMTHEMSFNQRDFTFRILLYPKWDRNLLLML